LLPVVCGQLWLFGNGFSTNSAHFCPAFGDEVLVPRRRRREGADPAIARVAASYGRFSTDLQDEASIQQQQRKCRERAELKQHRIEYEYMISDQRHGLAPAGLNRLLQAARERKFAILYLFSLSRLARESLITMSTLKSFCMSTVFR
jgi:hypothetical protein